MCVKLGGVLFHQIRDFKQYYFNSMPPTSHKSDPDHQSMGFCKGASNVRGYYGQSPYSTKILDFRGFAASIILILRGETLTSMAISPESLSQQILLGTILAGRLGVPAGGDTHSESLHTGIDIYIYIIYIYIYIYTSMSISISTSISISIAFSLSLYIYIYIYISLYIYTHNHNI